MIYILKVTIILCFILFIGYSFFLMLKPRQKIPFMFTLAITYGLGTGVISHWILILSIFNIPFSRMTIHLILLILACLSFWLNSKNAKKNFGHEAIPKIIIPKIDLITVSLLFYISFLIFFVFWEANFTPISSWDAFSVHAFKAKIIFFERSLKFLNNMPHPSYPLHISFLQAAIALGVGSWDHQIIKTIFPFYLLSFLIIQYFFMKNFVSKRMALLSLAFLLSSNFVISHSTIAYNDLTMLYYNCTTLFLLILWQKNKNTSFLILASIFSGFGSFVKLEGSGYILIHTIILIIILKFFDHSKTKKKVINFFTFIFPSYCICLFYHIYKFQKINAIKNENGNFSFNLTHLDIHFSLSSFERIKTILSVFRENLLFSNNWNIIWGILLLSLFKLFKKNITSESKILLAALCLYFLIYILGFSLTQHYYWATETYTVLSRAILHFFPLSIALIILINFADKEDHQN